MRILFTTDQIHLHGGIEKVMAEKANWFADVSGHEVFILTTEQQNLPPCYPLSSKIITKDKSQQQIDEILDKISQSGYDSLDKEEKEFLFRVGK